MITSNKMANVDTFIAYTVGYYFFLLWKSRIC